MANEDHLTELLVAHRRGDEAALGRLLPLVYQDLRRLARQQLARLRPGNTLDTTALVNEAYVKLAEGRQLDVRDRGHFFAIAATAMRQILVDHVRRQTSLKRGGEGRPVSLDQLDGSASETFHEQAHLLLEIDAALKLLEGRSPHLARVFECRFFLGLDEQECADALGTSLRTAQRHWSMARAWLRTQLTEA